MNNSKTKRRQRAIAIGGSFTGLLAARVLSDHFEQVTLIERDKINDRPEARKGQPQSHHAHSLLANGLDVLTRYFPDLPDGLRAGGATVTDIGTGFRWYASGGYRLQFESGLASALMSRPFLEWQIRRRVLALSNVTVLDQSTVTALLTTADGGRVTGVRTLHQVEKSREAALTADLVIDATGRGSAGLKWLEALGYTGPKEETVKVGVAYTSRIYRRRPGDLVGAELVLIAPEPPHNKRFGVMLPMEDDRWIVSLAGWAGNHAPANEAGFLEFARSLAAPDIYNMIPRLEPLTDFITHKFPSNLRHHYENLTRFPGGFLVMGDAIASFNPVYAQGMSSAAMQAAALDELLAGRGSLDGLWEAFFKRAAKVVDLPWQLAAGQDFRFPETRGNKTPGTDLMNAYFAKVARATHRDPVVYGAFLRVTNLMARRTSLFKLHILWRVLRGGIERRPVPVQKAHSP
ncbi:MAG: FAD-dependent oxidoreductase [Nitrospinota bacterium]